MKRSLIIIIGIVVVIALVAVWVYVLFLKTTPPPNTFSNLNLGNTTDSSVPPESNNTISDEPLLDVTSQKRIQQLTAGPVAGFQEVSLPEVRGSQVYYIESGTGHIHHLNLQTGEQKRVSATTVPSSQKGEITVDGNYVLIQSGFGSSKKFIVGELSSTTDEMSIDFIEDEIIDFKSTINNTFLYLAKEGDVLVGKEYSPISNTSQELFTIPFTEASISWGASANDNHYVYPKPTSKLEGYVYAISNKNLRRLPIDGYGVSVAGNGSYVLQSGQTNGNYSTNIYSVISGNSIKSSLKTIPEKCAAIINSTDFICASENSSFDEAIPDSWYKGDVSYSDGIWRVSGISGNSVFLLDTKAETGREVDIINPNSGLTDANIYFQNKNDQTLWLYKLVQVNLSVPSNRP